MSEEKKKRQAVKKVCVVLKMQADTTMLSVEAECKDLKSAQNWIAKNGEEQSVYRIGFLRPEGYTVETPPPVKQKLTVWDTGFTD